jgi:hypothetical protein
MKVYYYYHIPKTGGTSMSKFLKFLSKNVNNHSITFDGSREEILGNNKFDCILLDAIT